MLYAGFDCSTQSLTALVIDTMTRAVVFRESLPFSTPFTESAGGVVTASPVMWARALEAMLERIAASIDVRQLRAVSGSAQQHGSVYCGASPHVLTRDSSPIWMDSSTSDDCRTIEDALGGPTVVARLTGSRCYPRFTGPQIHKFARTDAPAYARTERIHLVSSYLASLLIGEHAPIDHADGSGMNLMNIAGRVWDQGMLDATAPGLFRRLPPLVPSSAIVGTVHEAWQDRFGLPEVRVVAWSGDNPCSLVGTGLIREGQLAISLGTSDTIFGPMPAPRVSEDGIGHVFASPLGDYMGITVFRNGSLARERVRDGFGLGWNEFSDALRSTPAGNDGSMMLPWFEPEITPPVAGSGAVRFGLDDAGPARHVRAIVEAQMMAMRRHSRWMGVTPRIIHATGGAAANREILQVMADVFDADVSRFELTESAALGAALRAAQADTGAAWADVIEGFVNPAATGTIPPIPEHARTYRSLEPLYAARERSQLLESSRT